MFPDELIGKLFNVYRGSPPIFSSFWFFEDDGVVLDLGGDPAYCHQITDQFYVLSYGENKFECLTIDFTPGENKFTIGDRGIPKVVNPVPPGAFNETVLCSLCSEATTTFDLAIVTEPTEIIPIKCDVPYFCTSGTGTICETPMTTTKTPITTTEKLMTTRKKPCARRRKHP
ncbi:uncharacterized protein LOC127710521 [Mytilus californianus]|uniref:uncharacterized protein LOC127710521 n=1 Tax=Mytilus californianus TaxID=6549 RepID=UPI002246260F|nr:uncharacterized protein LOC127710521 [Mytilus californianus]